MKGGIREKKKKTERKRRKEEGRKINEGKKRPITVYNNVSNGKSFIIIQTIILQTFAYGLFFERCLVSKLKKYYINCALKKFLDEEIVCKSHQNHPGRWSAISHFSPLQVVHTHTQLTHPH